MISYYQDGIFACKSYSILYLIHPDSSDVAFYISGSFVDLSLPLLPDPLVLSKHLSKQAWGCSTAWGLLIYIPYALDL